MSAAASATTRISLTRNRPMSTPITCATKCFATPKEVAVTVRYNMDQTALPTRKWGAFAPGTGVGGAGMHWTAVLIRPTPTDIKLKTYVDQAYKPGILQDDMRVMDFPFTWDEIEPYFYKFELICGQSGTTGNLRGQILEGRRSV